MSTPCANLLTLLVGLYAQIRQVWFSPYWLQCFGFPLTSILLVTCVVTRKKNKPVTLQLLQFA